MRTAAAHESVCGLYSFRVGVRERMRVPGSEEELEGVENEWVIV